MPGSTNQRCDAMDEQHTHKPFIPSPSFYREFPVMSRAYIPLGLEGLYTACRRIYPDQPNPLQVTAVVKYWLGGPDPLDYISMYSNPGNAAMDIPPHWHYIGFGLSDLHGDGRVHDISGADTPSGFGFELTFRLKREPGETAPPTWPAAIMQVLAKYVFHSNNALYPGDHVSWHCPLDNSESRIQHLLMQEDPQLGIVETVFGPVTFIQLVGVCSEELMSAQSWNGPGIIELMKSVKGAGGPWLITDMRRGESIFELNPTAQETADRGVETEGSNLSGVSCKCLWQEKASSAAANVKEEPEEPEVEESVRESGPQITIIETEQIKAALKKGLLSTKHVLPPIKPKSQMTMSHTRKESYDSSTSSEVAPLESAELLRPRTLESVHLQFNLEAGTLLPLALKGRLKHGRHFTFKSVLGEDTAITLVPPTVAGSFVDLEHPYAAHGPWLQVLLTEDTVEEILCDLQKLFVDVDAIALPKILSWPDKKISITLVQEEC